MFQISALIISYLIGSIPFGFLITYAVKHIDIRKYGSGNIGATNVSRIAGKKWGLITFAFDFLKGVLPVIIAINLLKGQSGYFYIAVALLAVSGHNWSIFLGFKGGKGVSTSIGAVSGLCFKYPGLIIPAGIAVIAWGVVFMLWRIVSISSIVSAFVFLIVSLFFPINEFKVVAFIIFASIVIRHKENIKNLLRGKELSI